jgi:glycine/D-amino acid oxidase-like deaminating enzyme
MVFRVAVVGGGIIGVSSAVRIVEECPGVKVVIFAEKTTPETTGDGAAGLWGPFLDGGTPAHKLMYANHYHRSEIPRIYNLGLWI